jgi:hypothetical protein
MFSTFMPASANKYPQGAVYAPVRVFLKKGEDIGDGIT